MDEINQPIALSVSTHSHMYSVCINPDIVMGIGPHDLSDDKYIISPKIKFINLLNWGFFLHKIKTFQVFPSS